MREHAIQVHGNTNNNVNMAAGSTALDKNLINHSHSMKAIHPYIQCLRIELRCVLPFRSFALISPSCLRLRSLGNSSEPRRYAIRTRMEEIPFAADEGQYSWLIYEKRFSVTLFV